METEAPAYGGQGAPIEKWRCQSAHCSWISRIHCSEVLSHNTIEQRKLASNAAWDIQANQVLVSKPELPLKEQHLQLSSTTCINRMELFLLTYADPMIHLTSQSEYITSGNIEWAYVCYDSHNCLLMKIRLKYLQMLRLNRDKVPSSSVFCMIWKNLIHLLLFQLMSNPEDWPGWVLRQPGTADVGYAETHATRESSWSLSTY